MRSILCRAAQSNKVALTYFILLWSVFALHLFTGIADNGDFSRTFSFLIEKPFGWSDNVPAINSPEWHRRFFYVWIDRWQLYPHLSHVTDIYSFSTQKVWMLVQVGASIALTGSSTVYSVIAGSIPGRAVYAAAFSILFFAIRRYSGVRAAWTYALVATPFILSSDFVAFLNSFFEEQTMIIALPVLATVIYLHSVTEARRYAIAALSIALFVALSKTAYFLLPLFIAPFISRSFGWKRVLLAAIGATIVATLPAAFGPNKGVNQYNALYVGALDMLKRENGVVLQTIGDKPVLEQCIGHTASSSVGRECVAAARATYVDTARVLLKFPTLGPRMICRTLQAGANIDASRNGLYPEMGPTFAYAPLFKVWAWLYAKHLNLAVLAAGMVAFVLSFSRRSRPLETTGLVFALWGGAQYALVLADGFLELQKHLVGANYCLSLAIVFLASAAFERLPTIVRSRQSAPQI